MGIAKYIPKPEMLWDLFVEYKEHTKANPRKKHVFVGKDGNSDYELLEVPLTMEGFNCYCWEKGVISELKDYFANKGGSYSEFSPVCSRIRETIRQDQITGGMVGQYNPSITQRLNNLKEATDITTAGEKLPTQIVFAKSDNCEPINSSNNGTDSN